MVKLLKEMLQLEAKDKEFLLSNITRITEGKGKKNQQQKYFQSYFSNFNYSICSDWLYDHINFDDVEHSSTWNYRNNFKTQDMDSNRNYQSKSMNAFGWL